MKTHQSNLLRVQRSFQSNWGVRVEADHGVVPRGERMVRQKANGWKSVMEKWNRMM